MVTALMISAQLATPVLFRIKIFQNKDDVLIRGCDLS